MTITVTASDIAEGIAESDSACPIAYAAYRVFGKRVSVGYKWLRVPKGGESDLTLDYLMPEEAICFAKTFDTPGGQVSPFSFELSDTPNDLGWLGQDKGDE